MSYALCSDRYTISQLTMKLFASLLTLCTLLAGAQGNPTTGKLRFAYQYSKPRRYIDQSYSHRIASHRIPNLILSSLLFSLSCYVYSYRSKLHG
jgi:hypothetical protein